MLSILRNESGSWTLIGLLVAVAVGFFVFFAVLMPKLSPNQRAVDEGLVDPKAGKTIYGASLAKAKETDCSARLRQIKMTIEAHKAEYGNAPATLQDLKLRGGTNFYVCPANNQPYQYDPASGTVRCTTPGHTGF